MTTGRINQVSGWGSCGCSSGADRPPTRAHPGAPRPLLSRDKGGGDAVGRPCGLFMARVEGEALTLLWRGGVADRALGVRGTRRPAQPLGAGVPAALRPRGAGCTGGRGRRGVGRPGSNAPLPGRPGRVGYAHARSSLSRTPRPTHTLSLTHTGWSGRQPAGKGGEREGRGGRGGRG